MSASKPIVFGVAGGTASGKTTVARSILDRVGAPRVAIEMVVARLHAILKN